MGESLTVRRRVREEGLRVVNLCQELGMWGGQIAHPTDQLQRKGLLTSCQQQR